MSSEDAANFIANCPDPEHPHVQRHLVNLNEMLAEMTSAGFHEPRAWFFENIHAVA